jgi:general nucleoside transport system ATP-binding protein
MALLSMVVVCLVFGLLSHLGAMGIITQIRHVLNKAKPKGGLLLSMKQSVGHANDLIKEFDIRTPSALTSGGSLSGGNQQKVVVAREFSRKPRLLIASQPTRGIDVGSIEFIHNQIITQRDQGAGVLLVSAELDEVMSLSDRIAVMYRGEIIDVVDAKTATREQLGLLMAGIK